MTPITPLRQRMIEDMKIRNLALNTQKSYVDQVARFAGHFHVSPERLGPEEIRTYQVHLTQVKELAPSSIIVAVSALRFLYCITLRRDWAFKIVIPAPQLPKTLPVVLSPEEVSNFLPYVQHVRNRTILTVCYAAGLRISEAVNLKVSDIDSSRMVLRVEQGKGQKDRLWAVAHNLSYVPGMVMCSWTRTELRGQAGGDDCLAHNYLPLSEAMSLSAGRKTPRLSDGGTTVLVISSFCDGSARR